MSGGGIRKHTPGKELTEPSGECTSHFAMLLLDFKVSFSPLEMEALKGNQGCENIDGKHTRMYLYVGTVNVEFWIEMCALIR